MQICKTCNVAMVGIKSFSVNKCEKFFRCPKCHYETKHIPIRPSELEFTETIHKEFKQRK